jgi:YggT family protein
LISILVQLILLLSRLITLLIVIHAVLSFILSPFHPIRETIDRIVDPMLRPIRQFMPSTGMLDFSPLILIILIQLVTTVLVNLLAGF